MSYTAYDAFDEACAKAHHSIDGEYFDLDEFCTQLRKIGEANKRAVLDIALRIISYQCDDDSSGLLETVRQMLSFDHEVCIIESSHNSLTMVGHIPQRATLTIGGVDDI